MCNIKEKKASVNPDSDWKAERGRMKMFYIHTCIGIYINKVLSYLPEES